MILVSYCQIAGRLLQNNFGEESPGSTETRCRVIPGGGDPRESATESKPPDSSCLFYSGKGERVW